MAVGQVNAHDPRVKRTRKLLQQTLFELMQEKSFDAITVQDIAERSTLNRATFYAHFEDKYDLLDSIMRESFEQALAGAVSDSAAVNADNLRSLCRTVFDFFAQLQEHCRPHYRLFDPLLERAVQDVLQAFLTRWLQRETPTALPAGVGVETVVAVLSWAIFGLGSQWSRGPRTQSADEAAAQLVAVLTSGLTGLVAP
jgi:AcrR family transcriptional regulator